MVRFLGIRPYISLKNLEIMLNSKNLPLGLGMF